MESRGKTSQNNPSPSMPQKKRAYYTFKNLSQDCKIKYCSRGRRREKIKNGNKNVTKKIIIIRFAADRAGARWSPRATVTESSDASLGNR